MKKTDLKFEETVQPIEIFKVFEKAETDQKYEETDLKLEETDQQNENFKVFEKSGNGSKKRGNGPKNIGKIDQNKEETIQL